MIVKPNNKEIKLDDVKLKEEIKNESFALMLEQSDGTYKESDTNIFPTDMVYNVEKSGCIDSNGQVVENSLSYNNGVINVSTNKTIYCYIYFDRKEDGSLTLSETSGTIGKGKSSTFTVVNNVSGGALSVVSNDNNIATASISGNTITITGVSEGSTTITVTSAETNEYLLTQATYIITIKGPITFTINGTNYNADYGMTWTEWFASDYNTTGETEGDIKDANGNDVSIDAVIVGGTAYEVGFGQPVTITLIRNGSNHIGSVTYNGTTYSTATTFTANIGDTIEIKGVSVAINDPGRTPSTPSSSSYYLSTSYTVVSDAIFEWKSQFSGVTSTGYYYLLSINEVSEGKALVQITGSGSQNAPIVYVEHNGVKYYNATSIVVNIGDTIFCKLNVGTYGGKIYYNGTSVGSTSVSSAEYTYTVTSNATINLGYTGTAYDSGGSIMITDN